MEKAYKFLAVGLGIGLLIAALGTFVIGPSLVTEEKLDCDQCHEGHGSVVAPDVNPYGMILLTGDTPDDKLIPVTDILKMPMINVSTITAQTDDGKGIPSWGVPVSDFLKAYGVTDFEKVIFYADDLVVSVNKTELLPENVLVPCEYSIRFLGPNVPVSIWIKGVESIVVVGNNGDSISLNGKTLTFGDMLEDGIDSMVSTRRPTYYTVDGKNYAFDSGYVVKGIGLKDLLLANGYSDFTKVTIKGATETIYTRDEVLGGSFFLTRDKGKVKLATADKNRVNWIDIDTITVER